MSETGRWLIRVCPHGHRIEWLGSQNTLGGWRHMDADAQYCEGGKAVAVVPASALRSTLDVLVPYLKAANAGDEGAASLALDIVKAALAEASA